MSNEKIFGGKYITQVQYIGNQNYAVSIWNKSGIYIVSRAEGVKSVKIEDPRYYSHTTDLKPMFEKLLGQEMPYLLQRNKNAISLVDVKNNHIQTLIEIRNSDLFCEKLQIDVDRVSGKLKMAYVTWQNDKTYIKEIELPENLIEIMKSAADL